MRKPHHITVLAPSGILEAALTIVGTRMPLGIYPDSKKEHTVDDVFRLLFSRKPVSEVCMAINAADLGNNAIADSIISLCHYANYYIADNKPRIIVMHESEQEKADDAAFTRLNEQAKAQGWAGIEAISFFRTPAFVQKDKTISLSVEQDQFYQEELTARWFQPEPALWDAEIVVSVKSADDAHNFLQTFSALEAAFIENNKALYNTYQELYYVKRKMRQLEAQLSRTTNELENEKQYNEILKSTQETQQILQFYHTEYEMLPLWYKQFGHIIKVLTGKRSLKSLFDDRIKTNKH